jgi:hypothetical protein
MKDTLGTTEDKLKSALVQAGYYRDAEREAFEKVRRLCGVARGGGVGVRAHRHVAGCTF